MRESTVLVTGAELSTAEIRKRARTAGMPPRSDTTETHTAGVSPPSDITETHTAERNRAAATPEQLPEGTSPATRIRKYGSAVLAAGTELSIAEIRKRALRQLSTSFHEGKVPHEITHHTSADSIKPYAQWSNDNYDDYGNWSGSVTVLMLLFPKDYGLEYYPPDFDLMKNLDGAGDRRDVLRTLGKEKQCSGKGQDNYRTNLMEALIRLLRDEVSYLQLLWQQVDLAICDMRSRLGNDTIMEFSQPKVIRWLLSEQLSDNEKFAKHLAQQATIHADIDLWSYFDYCKKIINYHQDPYNTPLMYHWEMIRVTGCSVSSARKLWKTIEFIQQKIAEKSTSIQESSPAGRAVPGSVACNH